LNTQIVEQAEGEILHDLLAKCHQFEGGFPSRCPGRVGRRWAGALLLLVGVGVAASLLVWTADGVWFPVLDRCGVWWRLVRGAVEHSSDTQRWVVAGAVLVLIGMYWVTRTPRT
jgi:hypothetical protein